MNTKECINSNPHSTTYTHSMARHLACMSLNMLRKPLFLEGVSACINNYSSLICPWQKSQAGSQAHLLETQFVHKVWWYSGQESRASVENIVKACSLFMCKPYLTTSSGVHPSSPWISNAARPYTSSYATYALRYVELPAEHELYLCDHSIRICPPVHAAILQLWHHPDLQYGVNLPYVAPVLPPDRHQKHQPG